MRSCIMIRREVSDSNKNHTNLRVSDHYLHQAATTLPEHTFTRSRKTKSSKHLAYGKELQKEPLEIDRLMGLRWIGDC